MISRKKFVKDIGILGLTNLIFAFRGIFLLPIITKLLGVVSYGIWTQLMVSVSLVVPLMLLGIPAALVRFLAGREEKRDIQEGVYSSLLVVFTTALLAGFFLILFSEPIANIFHYPRVFVIFLALIILFETLNAIFLNAFRALHAIKTYSFFVIFQTAGEISLVFAAISLGYGLYGAVASFLISRVILFFLSFFWVYKKIGIRIPQFSQTKEYLAFGLPTIASGASYWAITSSDKYLVGFFLGALFVGYYTPAYTIGNVLVLFVFPFSLILPSVLSKFFDENNISEMKLYLSYSLKYFLAVAIPAVFGISVLSWQLLRILSTVDIANNGYFVTPFIALGMLCYGVYTIIAQILDIVKKTKLSALIWMIAAAGNLVLNMFFISSFGILGAAITTLAAYGIALALTVYFSFKEFTFEIDTVFIVKSIAASTIMAIIISFFNPQGLLHISAVIMFSAFFYGGLMIAARAFNKREEEVFFSLSKKVFSRQ